MNAALAACHTQVIAVRPSVRRETVLDVCVIGGMKATEVVVWRGVVGIKPAVGIGKMDAVFQ